MKKNQYERRMSALVRLEAQLEAGIKNSDDKQVPLTESDKKRITKEVDTLTKRLKNA